MSGLYSQIQESAAFISKQIQHIPDHAIILGTGFGSLSNRIEVIKEISYKVIPHFAPTTVESHSGKLIFAKWKNKPVLILSGRLHYYEGYSTQEITLMIRVLKALGVKKLWITNASGTVNPEFVAGDVVFINDHINFHPENPLRGLHDPILGNRFPDMSDVYNKDFLKLAEKTCNTLNLKFNSGIYFGLQGPSLETPAEYKMIRLLGADIVGMSTVPEVIVAHQCELKIMAVSIVTNSSPQTGQHEKTTLESVIEVIKISSNTLFDLLEGMLVVEI